MQLKVCELIKNDSTASVNCWFVVGNEVTLKYGLVFPILTCVFGIWDWESAEYDESCLVWWEVSWPRKQSPPFGNLWPLWPCPSNWKKTFLACLLWIHRDVTSKLILRFSALPKLLQECVLWHLVFQKERKKTISSWNISKWMWPVISSIVVLPAARANRIVSLSL
jgi:hypothetical protein